MKATFKLQGTKELDAALAEFTKATARNVLQRALMKGAEPILEEARRLAPERSGVLKSRIRKDTRKPKGHPSKAAFAEALRNGATRAEAGRAQRQANRENGSTLAEVFVGVEAGVRQAWPQEVGTERHGPQPYMRPAFETKHEEALGIMIAEIKPEIDKAAERARRKALRKVAKG